MPECECELSPAIIPVGDTGVCKKDILLEVAFDGLISVNVCFSCIVCVGSYSKTTIFY